MADNKSELFRMIPAVDRLLDTDELKNISESYPRNLILRAINDVLSDIRKGIEKEDISKDRLETAIGSITEIIKDKLSILSRPSLKNVINATGVVIHTNLGRSILADRVIKRFKEIGGGYSNLEYDLEKGKRGSRYSHVEGILKELTSAEAAMVVNNNAAAVLIVLETIAKEREVIISRGELVEIGGSFRIPDVMKKSGAKMVEVGTTNKTHLKDYEEAINPETAVILKVHKSNFQIVGFNEEVDREELVELGKKHDLPVIEDLGSGSFIDLTKYGLAWEPTVESVLESGVDLVTFSGDKMLGGPQAGIILGKKELVEKVRQNQLSRALRIDKLTLLALEETLNIYRDEKGALEEIPTMRMICQTYASLKAKAGRLNRMIETKDGNNFIVDTVDGISKVGGGALPLMELPTRLVRLTPKAVPAQQIHESFKSKDIPIIVRVEQDKVLLDVRTIQDSELKTVASAINDLNRI
ncbi:L-seryl-tRNA(Sec) selenium transferase [Thermodesulfobacteriota bacterium]